MVENFDEREDLPVDVYVVIEGEPFLSRAKEYRRKSQITQDAWHAFARNLGATQVWGRWELSGLTFPHGKIPKGWRNPDTKGRSRPYKDSEASRAILSLPRAPLTRDVFGDAIVEDIRYHAVSDPKNCYGIAAISRSFEPWVGWIEAVYVARIPHAGNAAKNHLAQYPDHAVDPPALGWTVPQGLREISEAEYDLMVATYKVLKERQKQAA